MKYRFHVVYSREAQRWMGEILGLALMDCLREMGFEATCTLGPPMAPESADNLDAFIFMGLESIGVMGQGWPRLGPVFLYNAAETDEDHRFWRAWRRRLARNYEHTDVRLDAILDYSRNNRDKLRKIGFEKIDLPIGFHERFDFAQPRWPYAFSFIGRVHPDSRRHQMLAGICRRWPSHFVQARGDRNYFSMTREGLCLQGYQAPVTIQLNRDGKANNFASCRVIMMGMSNRQAVVNERSSWWPECLRDDLWVNSPTERVMKDAEALIDEPARAKEMGERAYEVIRAEYRLQDHVETAMKEFGIL